ncbi:MAG: alpha/beta hydrolase [Betaproteobacteria bacterium]
MKPSTSRFLPLRGLTYHLREWGRRGAPPVVLLHGWMDMSASFQFVVDELRGDWHLIAPDWRGFGRSGATGADCYWFPDYLGDLDALLDAVSPHEPVALVGHSMGGNVALMYAGARPQRVRALVNLEGFGLHDTTPEMAPARYACWLDELREQPPLRDYATREAVALRLRKTNPRLSEARAAFLAEHWAVPTAEGRWRLAADPAHRLVNPTLYRWAEVAACWARIACPVLWVEGADTDAHKWAGDAAELERRRAVIPICRAATVPDAGHMLHHDQPAALARLIEEFLVA